MPEKEEECGMKSEVLNTVIEVGDYLPHKISEYDKGDE